VRTRPVDSDQPSSAQGEGILSPLEPKARFETGSGGALAMARSRCTPRVRDYVRADRAFLEQGVLALLEEEAPFDPLRLIVPPNWWGKTHSQYLLSEVRKGRGHTLAAQAGRKRIGFVVGARQPTSRGKSRAFDLSRRPCCIYALYVAPDYRRGGVGTLLLEVVEERLRAQGCDLAHMVGLAGNAPARTLYRARGYEERVLWWAKWLNPPSRPRSRRQGIHRSGAAAPTGFES